MNKFVMKYQQPVVLFDANKIQLIPIKFNFLSIYEN